MDAWLDANATTLVVVLAAATAVLLVAALTFLILWRRARRAARLAARARSVAERERIDLELSLAEQGSRLRMIRELHEIAVHSVSVIISQADGARYAATQDPAAAGRSAAVIADSARATLADLRRVMTVVRDGEAEASPQPALSSARELFKVMRDAGLDVEFQETGERHELRPGAELAIFRILQEALSNALSHGGEGTRAKVAFTWTDDGLKLLVEDDGTRAELIRNGLDPYAEAQRQSYTVDDDLAALTQTPTGRGITEMRERTELFGGVFEAHLVPGVGFTVQAVFPALRYHNGVHGVRLDPAVSGAPIRVLLVDDSADQRAGYKLLLGSQPDLEVVGQAGDGAQALGILRREQVDVVLMDVQMPRVNGLVAAERIRSDPQVGALGVPPRIVLLATVDLEDHVPAAAISGAFAILYKDVDPEALFGVIRDAAAYHGDL